MIDRLFDAISRHWVAVIVVGTLIGAGIGAAINSAASDVYVARSLVVLTEANIPPEEFAEVAEAVFATDAVLRPVIRDLGLSQTPAQLIAAGTISLEPEPGGLAVNVVARSNGPDLAVAIANATAEQLTGVSEVNGIGQLAVFRSEGPATAQADPLWRDVAVGGILGALIAAVDVAIVILVQRRQLDADARYRFDAMARADVTIGPGPDATPLVTAPYPLSEVVKLISHRANGGEVTSIVVDAGRELWASLAVADELARIVEREGTIRSLRILPAGEEPDDGATGDLIVIAAEHTPVARLGELGSRIRPKEGAGMTLLLVRAIEER